MRKFLNKKKTGGMLLLCLLFLLMQGNAAVFGADLVHHWTLDETDSGSGATVTDIVAGLNGTVAGTGVTPQAGMVGGALHFAGNVDDHVTISDFSTTGLKNMTLTFWMNMDEGTIASLENGDYQRIISGNDGFEAIIQADDSSDTGRMGNNLYRTSGKDLYVLTQDLMPEGVWVHVAMTASLSTAPGGTGLMEIYLNGELDNSRPDGALIDWSGGELRFAHRPGTADDNHYSGLLDDIRIYNDVLSADEIKAIYESAFAGPVAIYPKSLPDPAGKNMPADVTFAWTFSDGADVIIDSYTIYMDTDASLVAEPNLPGQPMLIDGTGDATVILPVSAYDPNATYSYSGIAEDTVYYWRVETAVLEPNLVDPQNPVYDIPGVIHGTVWSFTGVLSVPAITLQPEDMYLLPDPITHTLDNATATFSVEFNAGKPLDSIIWMKDGSPLTIDGAKYVQADEVDDLADASTMLTINNVGTADEGAYSVIITLLAGGAGSATSDEATLSVVLDSEILAHRWSFNNDLIDSVGGADGVIVDPADENITFTADEVVFGGRLELGDNQTSDDPNLHFVDLPNGIVSALGDHATFMTWYTIKDPEAPSNVRVFTAGDADGSGTEAEWVDGAWTGMTGDGAWIEISTRGGNIAFASRGSGAVEASDGPASDYVDKEVCVAGVWDGSAGQMILYIDGVQADTATLNRKLSDLVDVSNWLGRSNSTADKTFVGSINEFRIYSIPLTGPWVEALYEAGPNGEALNVDPCHFPKDFDYDGDCMVNLIDFGIFAEQWLDCGFLSCQ